MTEVVRGHLPFGDHFPWERSSKKGHYPTGGVGRGTVLLEPDPGYRVMLALELWKNKALQHCPVPGPGHRLGHTPGTPPGLEEVGSNDPS